MRGGGAVRVERVRADDDAGGVGEQARAAELILMEVCGRAGGVDLLNGKYPPARR